MVDFLTKPTVIILGTLLLDQLTKLFVLQNQLPHRLNTGGAFSLLANRDNYLLIALGILATLLATRISSTRQKSENRLLKTGWALLIGGAFSNTLDRVLRDGVIDFIYLGPLPVFNFADTAIVSGLILIIFAAVLPRKPLESPYKTA